MEAELLPLQSCSWVILPCKMCLVAQHGADRAGALQGRIVEVRGPDDEARVIYDDDMEEWLSPAAGALPVAGAPRAVCRRHARAAGGDAHSRAALLLSRRYHDELVMAVTCSREPIYSCLEVAAHQGRCVTRRRVCQAQTRVFGAVRSRVWDRFQHGRSHTAGRDGAAGGGGRAGHAPHPRAARRAARAGARRRGGRRRPRDCPLCRRRRLVPRGGPCIRPHPRGQLRQAAARSYPSIEQLQNLHALDSGTKTSAQGAWLICQEMKQSP